MNKNKKNIILLIILIIMIAIIILITFLLKNETNSNTQNLENEVLSELSVEYSEDESKATWDGESATKIALNNTSASIAGTGAIVSGKNINITQAGTYYITGNLDDGSIVIQASAEDKIKLVLDNATIKCSSSAAIYTKQAKKTIITLADGSINNISDGSTYTFETEDTDEPNATIFSNDNIVINGTGTLNVTANYADGIASSDNIKIVNGTINITANDDGIRGKDYVAIKNGTINIKSKSDGIKSTNSEDAEKGYILIENGNITIDAGEDAIQAETRLSILNGTFKISAGDDGIHANVNLVIDGGTINIIKCYEGIESANIQINGGIIELVASDDGINAAGGATTSTSQNTNAPGGMQSTSTGTITINGGYIYVDAAGDGIDINGSGYINGGTIIVNGPTNNGNGSLDYDGELKVTGGLVIAAGSSGMLQSASTSSTEYCISVGFTNSQSANSLVSIVDSNGNSVITFAPSKTYQAIVVCSPEFTKGNSYTIYTGGNSTGTSKNGLYTGGTYTAGTKISTVTLSNIITLVGNSTGMNGKGANGGMNNGGRR